MDHSVAKSETKQFGRYEIVGELGRGAMGVVYKARDPQIDRLVALKTVPLRGQEPEEEKEFRRRFLNEAQAAGRLHHPGIVSVFDVGEDPENHDPYIVLEYVAGEALNRVLKREKKLPLEKALQLTEEIAEALDYAHAQKVIHRDVKPGNILITEDGHAKVADFGIAKLNLAHFTLPGRVLGTPAYMAPEQLSGEGADGRSDLFSLGVILYAMVTGHSPFQGDSATTVCFKVANREPVPASALDLNLPGELDEVISRAMAKDPKKRYQRGAEFAEEIRNLQERLKPHGTTTSLQATSGTGTRKPATAADLSRRPAVGPAYAAKLVRAAILKAPVKDLILGVATVVLLLIVGVQSKLLVSTREEAADPEQIHNDPIAVAQLSASQVPASANGTESSGKATAPDASPAKPINISKPTLRKAAVKAIRKNSADSATARQVVVPLSMVELAVRHQFKEATLYVWVDDKLALTRPLHGGTQRRLVVFNGVRGVESETLKVPAGKHVLRFNTQTADQTVNLSKTISREFIGGDDKTLEISFDKHNTAMHLDWQ
jgi:serine/threonine-protein kinase